LLSRRSLTLPTCTKATCLTWAEELSRKKSSETLRKLQEQLDLRRKLLESGKIRLTPEKSKEELEDKKRNIQEQQNP
jgi:hypothetical protein